MFNEYKGTIKLENVLKDKYDYTFHGDLKDLSSENFIEMEGNGVDALFWINYNNERFLFKPIRDAEYNIWGELLSQKIAKAMNIPCAEYRLASFNGQTGVITKSFLNKDDELIMGDELFQKFFNEYPYEKETDNLIYDKNIRELYQIPEEYTTLGAYDRRIKTFTHLNNLMDSWTILETIIPDRNKTQELVQNLLKMTIFDCITLQGDRHPNNWGFVKNKEGILNSAPLYDNSASLGLGYPYMEDKVNDFQTMALNMKYQGTYQIDKIIDSIRPNYTLENKGMSAQVKSTTNKGLFRQIVHEADEETFNYIYDCLNKLNEDTIEEMITSIEEENDIRMNNSIHFYITFLLEYNLKNLKEIANEYKKDEQDDRARGTK